MTTVFPEDDELREKNDKTMDTIAKKKASSQSKPNYYAILPAEIRYDPGLTWMEKVLYAEITALSNKDGYCYATNAFFSKHYDVSSRTVTRAIANLVEKGFLFSLLENSGTHSVRKIYLRENAEKLIPQVVAHKDGVDKSVLLLGGGVDKNVHTPLDKNVQHNNTSINTINNTNIPASQAEPEEVKDRHLLPSWLGKNSHARIGRLYELLWESKFGVPHKFHITGKTGSMLKNLLAESTESMVALMLVVHFEWRGMSGNDERALKNLHDNGYPFSWLPSKVSLYKAYILKTMGLDDETKQAIAIGKVLTKISKD